MFLKQLLLCAVFPIIFSVCAETVYTTDFEKDFKKFKPYANDSPVLKNGKLHAKKGTQTSVTLPAPGRYKIKVSVPNNDVTIQIVALIPTADAYGFPEKGKNDYELSVFCGNQHLSFCVISHDQKPFVIEKISVEREAFTEPEDTDVKNIAFEAEDFPGSNGWLKKDNAALNSAYCSGKLWFAPVRNLPAPYTSKPVYLYARCRTNAGGNGMFFLIQSGRQRADKLSVVSPQFKWIRTNALDARVLNHAVDFSIVGNDYLDRISEFYADFQYLLIIRKRKLFLFQHNAVFPILFYHDGA